MAEIPGALQFLMNQIEIAVKNYQPGLKRETLDKTLITGYLKNNLKTLQKKFNSFLNLIIIPLPFLSALFYPLNH